MSQIFFFSLAFLGTQFYLILKTVLYNRHHIIIPVLFIRPTCISGLVRKKSLDSNPGFHPLLIVLTTIPQENIF